MKKWLSFVSDCITAREWGWLRKLRLPILMSLRRLGQPDAQLQLAQATWDLLQKIPVPNIADLRHVWNMERFNFFTYFDRQDWEAMERVAWQGIREWQLDGNATGVIVARAALGQPTPNELVRAVDEGGVERVDSYGLFGWYLVAREAAAAGDESKAFYALRRSLGYWSNPPYSCMDIWEQDARWGKLRSHPQFKMIFDEKRRRIGPIHGLLHYFPDW